MKFKKGDTPWNKGKKGVQVCTKETRKKLSIANTGKKRSKETCEKLREINLGNKNCLGRVLSEETKDKIRKKHLRKTLSDEHKKKLSISHMGKIAGMLNKKHSIESINKMKKSLKGSVPWNKGLKTGPAWNSGKKGVYSKETLKKFSESSKGRPCPMKGKKHSKIAKERMRVSHIKYVEKKILNGEPMRPNIGKNETNILNILEKNIGYKIQRQHRVAGYFLDGYCGALNLAIEIDEKAHFTEAKQIKDKLREQNIINRLGCQFLRIRDGVC